MILPHVLIPAALAMALAALPGAPGLPANAPAGAGAGIEGLPRRIITEGLDQRDIELVGLGAAGPVTIDGDARALVPGALACFSIDAAGPRDSGEPWRLELIDGQVLFGRPRESVPGETITWELAGGTALLVPLDLVHTLAEASSPRLAFDTRSDVRDIVITTSGDQILGFVAGLGSGVLIETENGLLAVELSQVREVRLASDPEPAGAPLLWLDDGSVLAARLAGAGEGVRVECEPLLEVVARSRQGLTRLVAEVRAVNFAPTRLRPLAALGPPVVSPAEGRRWTPGPEFGPPGDLGLSAITLPGPMTLTWSLPAGAKALSLRVRLAPEARRWGDCILRFETSGPSQAPQAELRLSAANAEAMIRFDLDDASELRLLLLPGERGPIQDRVIITEAVVLLEPEGA